MKERGVQYRIKAIDDITSVMRKVNSLHGKATVGFKKVNKTIAAGKRPIKSVEFALDRLGRKATHIPKNIISGFSRIPRALGPIGTAIGTAFAVGGIASFTKGVTNTLAEFERMEAVLENTLGSKGAAKFVMNDISKFASKTPYQVNELTNSWVKLANQGFRPSMAEMTKLGDLASSTGKSFDQLSEAIIDGQVGEFERLKEFGIRAEKSGNKIAFTFKNQRKVVDNNSQSIRSYLLSLGEAEGVQGAMNKISKTTGGLLSNLQDRWIILKKTFGEANKWLIELGIKTANKAVAKLQVFAQWTKNNKEMLQSYVVSGLKVAYGWMKGFVSIIANSISWIQQNRDSLYQMAGSGLKVAEIIGAIWIGIKLFSGASAVIAIVHKGWVAFSTVLALVRSGTLAATAAQLLLNGALWANPIGVVIGAVTLLVGGLVLLASKFSFVREKLWALAKFIWKFHPFGIIVKVMKKLIPGFGQMWDKFVSWIKKKITGLLDWINKIFSFTGLGDLLGVGNLNLPTIKVKHEKPDIDEDNSVLDFDKNNIYSSSGAGSKPTAPRQPQATVGSRLSGVVTGGNVKNITINIEKLVESFVVKSERAIDNAAHVQRIITETLLRAVADVQNG